MLPAAFLPAAGSLFTKSEPLTTLPLRNARTGSVPPPNVFVSVVAACVATRGPESPFFTPSLVPDALPGQLTLHRRHVDVREVAVGVQRHRGGDPGALALDGAARHVAGRGVRDPVAT